jgi:hypothetical protein
MDCRQFRQTWEPDGGTADSARLHRHASRCEACRQWQAEQTDADQWLRASLRAAVEAPVAPTLGARLRVSLPRPLPPRSAVAEGEARQRPLTWQDLREKVGYAAAAALTAAALLAAALRPEP